MILSSIFVQTATSRSVLRPFRGHITDVVRLGANGGFARYAPKEGTG